MHLKRVAVDIPCDRLCLLFTAALVVWFCQDLVLSESVPFFRDLSTYFYPLRFILFENYRSGNLPLWDRHLAMGFPVLADFQSGAFYPPHLLFLGFPFFTAIRLIYIFHFVIAAMGAYKLFRSWNYPCYSAILGSILFALGGTVVSLSNLLNHFQAAVWLPWVILFWENAIRTVSWKNFLTFVLLLAGQFLAGSPELFALSMALVLIDGLRIKASMPAVSYGRMIGTFICANLLVVALCMVQVLPTIELFLESRRQRPIPVQEALYWSLTPWALFNLIFLDKEVDSSASIGMRLFFARESTLFVSYYLGAVSLFGICIWLCLDCLRHKLALLGLVLASLFIAFGSYTPIYPFLLGQMPILGAIRFPEKFFFFSYALFVYMAVKGLAESLDGDKVMFKKTIIIFGAICVAWVGVYLYVQSNPGMVGGLITVGAGVHPSSDLHAKMIAAVLANLERQIILCIALLLLFVLAKTEKIRRGIFVLLIVSVTIVDLTSAHRGFLFPLDPDFIYKSARILQKPDHDRKRLFYYPSDRNLHPSSFLVQGQPRFKEATALFLQNLLPNEGVFHGFEYFQEIDALARWPYTEFLSFANQLAPEQQIQLLRTFNVGYLISFQPLSEEGMTFVGHYPQYFSWLYKIDNPIPRAYIVNRSSVEQASQRILRRLLQSSFDPAQEVVLDQSIPIEPKGRLEAAATIVDYSDQQVIVQASLNDAGILVLADSYYPGWKAYIDGKEETIRRANLFFRAVPLPAGDHRVEFRYEPRSFAIGLAISISTVVAIVIISAVCHLRRRRAAIIPVS